MLSPRSNWLAVLQLLHAACAVTITDQSSFSGPGMMYGQMFEDINHSGDGGLYGELLLNRAFQGSRPDLSGHYAIDEKSSISLSYERPLSQALPASLKLITSGEGEAGFVSTGFNGFGVKKGHLYRASVYVNFNRTQAQSEPAIHAHIKDRRGRIISSASLVETRDQLSLYPAVSTGYVRYAATLRTGASSDNSTLEITTDLSPQESAYFTLISLLPQTTQDLGFDVRQDLFDALKHMKPSFMRFPGGNNLQGQTIDSRWKWNETIGPLTDRPGRDGTWDYHNTDGMVDDLMLKMADCLTYQGLLEWLQFLEKGLNVLPILGVYAGYSLNHEFVPTSRLQPYIDDVMNELEYIKGDVTTKYGALRLSHGRREPFVLNHVEIGNEDWLSDAGKSSYPSRFAAFAEAIRTKYPDLVLIATTDNVELPENSWVDEHFYPSPQGLIDMFHRYDTHSNSSKVFVGEYSCRFYNGQVLRWPNVIGAVAEAVFAIGAERNSDKVVGITYAPVLANVSPGAKSLVQWHPNLISFAQSKVVLSTSYLVQRLLSQHPIHRVLTLQNATHGPLYYVCGMSKAKAIVIKIANPTGTAQTIAFSHNITGLSLERIHGKGITGNATDANTEQSHKIKIQSMEADLIDDTIRITMPAYSFAVYVAE